MVELRIVLVILGLLTGGILSGQSLIRAAELRKIPTALATSEAAIKTFKEKYFYLPGDMPNATQFWGRQLTGSDCPSNSAAAIGANGTCDGNGNGLVAGDENRGMVDFYEVYWLWRQLALSGLIPGAYSGLHEGGRYTIPGTNAPALWGRSGFLYSYNEGYEGSHYGFPERAGFNYSFGSLHPSSGSLDAAITTVEETWNIDTKIDDGMASGLIPTFGTPGFGRQ